MKFLRPQVQNFHFTLQPALFRIFHILWFPFDTHVKFQKFRKIWKVQNFKNLKKLLCKDVEEKNSEKFKMIWWRFVEAVAFFFQFSCHMVPCSEKGKTH